MSHQADTENHPAHAGKGHLVENIVVFGLIFGAFLLSIYLLNWLTLDTVWPMAVIVVVAFLVFYIPQGILGRADTGYNLAEGNRTDKKEKGTAVSS
ncbi:Uncharacterised protein [Arthrobacter agilis]|uniref:hypothetical protein n=1 Tax=Arthrobacter agilis TaxID=37921 RepID=UPI000B57DD84|nr:hypothetical protein [Arthrobacter agilis]OUM40468.1 hypothetical protein B8W74_13190 [Arthrobacter agilis]VDR31561.1 Uncharacterised protein [Arthrobacter agilis]